MFLEKFIGKRNTGDIDTKDNKITNVVFFAGLVVTLLVVVALIMYAFL